MRHLLTALGSDRAKCKTFAACQVTLFCCFLSNSKLKLIMLDVLVALQHDIVTSCTHFHLIKAVFVAPTVKRSNPSLACRNALPQSLPRCSCRLSSSSISFFRWKPTHWKVGGKFCFFLAGQMSEVSRCISFPACEELSCEVV